MPKSLVKIEIFTIATKRTKKSSSDDIEQLKENLKKTLGCADFLSTCKVNINESTSSKVSSECTCKCAAHIFCILVA